MVEKYTKVEKIAQGSYGIVYKGRDNTTHQPVALKKFKITNQKQGIPQNCLREIQMLRTLQGRKQVIQIKDVILSHHGCVTIVYQFHEMSLKKFLNSNNTSYKPQNILRQLVFGIKVLHDYNIIHRDLKPDNILLTKNMELRLADFGHARQMPQDQQDLTNQVSTLSYRAPELLLGDRRYSKAVDIWSTGCIFYQLLKKNILFKGKTDIELAAKIFGTIGKLPHPTYLTKFADYTSKIAFGSLLSQQQKKSLFQGISDDALDLLLRMLDLNPQTRITIGQILKHKYLSEFIEKSNSSQPIPVKIG